MQFVDTAFVGLRVGSEGVVMASGRGNRRGLEDFPDPFASFGMGMGGGSRRGSILDVFDNDPFFNDPFFTRPFGSFFGPTGGLFGANGFLGSSNYFGQAPPPPPPGGYLEQRPHNQQQVRCCNISVNVCNR